MERNYIRDGRAPIPADPRTSALMSRIRGKNTAPEMFLRNALRRAGHTGYRLHHRGIPGRPDIAFVGKKVAVFVHGCFWHGCPHCSPARPKSNSTFWSQKLENNKARDKRKSMELKRAGWKVVTIWECRLRRAPKVQLARVIRSLV